jgi:DNA polymerase IV
MATGSRRTASRPDPPRWAASAARTATAACSRGTPNSRERTLDVDLIALVDRLARRLRTAHRVCRTVTLRLRFDDLSRATRSHTLPQATADTVTLLEAGRALLAGALAEIEPRGITLIGITFSNLFGDDAVQLALPFDGSSPSAMDATPDRLHERFGSSAVTRGVLLGCHEGLRVPLLPDR